MAYTYQLTPDGSGVRRSDGAFIPNEPANLDWQEYLAWEVGNDASAATVKSIDAIRADAVLRVNAQAATRREALVTHGSGADVVGAFRWREAELCSVDGTPTNAEYPILAAEIGFNGADVAAVATNVLSQNLTLRTSLGAIEDVRLTANDAIAAAANQAAVDAIIAAITWP